MALRSFFQSTRNFFIEQHGWDSVMKAIEATGRPKDPISFAKPFNGQQLSLAIVEPREHPHLRPVLYNVANVYKNSDVSLFIFHSDRNKDLILDIVQNWANVHLVNLKQDNLRPIIEYSQLLCSLDFYAWFQSKFVLIFQTDTLLRRAIDTKWFQFDYVGAPSPDNTTLNGGLSLRRVEAFRTILKRSSWTINMAEDKWWTSKFDARNILPKPHVAREFAVEAFVHTDSVGLHQIYNYHGPEVTMALTRAALPCHVTAVVPTTIDRLPKVKEVLDRLSFQCHQILVLCQNFETCTPDFCQRFKWIFDYDNVQIKPGHKSVLQNFHVAYEFLEWNQEGPAQDFMFLCRDDILLEQNKVCMLLSEYQNDRIVAGSGFTHLDLTKQVYGTADILSVESGVLIPQAMYKTREFDKLVNDQSLHPDVALSHLFRQAHMTLWSIQVAYEKKLVYGPTEFDVGPLEHKRRSLAKLSHIRPT
jgi:hypothetical protein